MPTDVVGSGGRQDSLRAGLALFERMWRAGVPDPPRWVHPMPEAGLLAWLRRLLGDRLHTEDGERALAGWLGADLFGLRRLPPAPGFVGGMEFARLRPEHVGPLLRRISLTRPAPSPEELTATALDAEHATVFRARRAPGDRGWGQPAGAGAPTLGETVEIPFVVHGIWLGQPMPVVTAFREHYAAAARRFPEATVVLWTDIPRARAAAVLAELEPRSRPAPPPAEGPADDRLADVRPLVTWARDSGVALVNVHEVFHAGHPLYLHPQYVLEMAKQRPRGYTSATDHLRVELVHTFGGLYIDGDIRFDAGPPGGAEPASLPGLFAAVAAAPVACTLNVLPAGVSNDLILGPARHPLLRLWMECARLNYSQPQREIAGGLEVMARPYVGHSHQGLRHLAPHRTGRVHHAALELTGVTRDDLVPTAGAVVPANEVTWVPKGRDRADIRLTGDSFLPRMPGADRDEVLERTMGLATFLIWQLVAREGNLYLSAVEPVVAALPDPDAVWTALLRLLAALEPVRAAVTSITAQRLGEGGAPEHLWLPPQAAALIDDTSVAVSWFGRDPAEPDRPVWLLDEVVAPAALRRPGA
ncbi:hypothetical protein [Frankia sp. AgB32]|uniref:hypothetical protein n=1 Tax=Frankia sp. AgB32 TaxID=631119 RepID=UPI002010681E|nr:hypothetical protein [Frankia sp. AgB32]MCK9896994.1 hypothetical protein [Frankia sp. AgB32]